MRLLNAGCGGQRDQSEHWYNIDNLRTQLKEGTPERINLDKEPRYIEVDLLTGHLPFADEAFDGILLQHVIEHFTCHEAVGVIGKLRRILKKGGRMMVTVPNAGYFMDVYDKDTKDRAFELFGEPIHDAGYDKFFDYALFRHDHKQVLTGQSLACLMVKSGFPPKSLSLLFDMGSATSLFTAEVELEMINQLSRRKFSLEMIGVK